MSCLIINKEKKSFEDRKPKIKKLTTDYSKKIFLKIFNIICKYYLCDNLLTTMLYLLILTGLTITHLMTLKGILILINYILIGLFFNIIEEYISINRQK